MIKKYNNFITEGIIDLLKGVSLDEINEIKSKMNPFEFILKIKKIESLKDYCYNELIKLNELIKTEGYSKYLTYSEYKKFIFDLYFDYTEDLEIGEFRFKLFIIESELLKNLNIIDLSYILECSYIEFTTIYDGRNVNDNTKKTYTAKDILIKINNVTEKYINDVNEPFKKAAFSIYLKKYDLLVEILKTQDNNLSISNDYDYTLLDIAYNINDYKSLNFIYMYTSLKFKDDCALYSSRFLQNLNILKILFNNLDKACLELSKDELKEFIKNIKKISKLNFEL